ncbi:hypothetical protein IPH25_04045 [bacterium]|nr:MAG: hypothetical protein IPG37_01040 [bacterium]QQR61618.1 MAG: hypothetical protein IPH25_04045 [bacterium]
MMKLSNLLCVLLVVTSSQMHARYPFLRIGHEKGEKQITITNQSDQRIYLKLKPKHIKPICADCIEQQNNQTPVNSCCQMSVPVEYVVAPHSSTKFLLGIVNVGMPNQEDEILDFTGVFYGMLHLENSRPKTYITLKDTQEYLCDILDGRVIVK